MKAGKNTVLVRVTKAERDAAERTQSGFFLPTDWHPMAYMTQKGKIISVGENLNFLKEGDTLFFSHLIQSNKMWLLDFDVEGNETWAIMEMKGHSYIYGYERGGELYPVINYIIAYPEKKFTGNLFTGAGGMYKPRYHQNPDRTFKVKVEHVNPDEKILKKGDLVLCKPKSNYEIKFKGQPLWFIGKENMMMRFDSDTKLYAFDKPSGTKEKKLDKHTAKQFLLTEIN